MFEIVTLNQKPWVSADVLARALEFDRTDSLLRLYHRNKSEFTENDVFVDENGFSVNLTKNSNGGRTKKSTYFSEDGAILLCMFARTEKAKEVRRLIREVFMNWYRGQSAARLPESQPALFALPEPKVDVKIDQRKGLVTLKLPLSQLHRLSALSGSPEASEAPSPAPQPALGPAEPPDMPHFRYDFASDCQGMHGWFTSWHIADVVGCCRETVHKHIRTHQLPPGWASRRKQGKIWVYIP